VYGVNGDALLKVQLVQLIIYVGSSRYIDSSRYVDSSRYITCSRYVDSNRYIDSSRYRDAQVVLGMSVYLCSRYTVKQ
jgi:hypothetical protein